MATGGPLPSPTVKTEPRAVANRKVPRRTNRLSNNSSSRSIGRTTQCLQARLKGRIRQRQYRGECAIRTNSQLSRKREDNRSRTTASLSRNYAIDTGFGFDRRQLRRAWRLLLLKMNRQSLPKAPFCLTALAVLLSLWPLSGPLAQDQSPPPQGTSRGENFSAKPPAQLFASDCTGAGCHKGPRGSAAASFRAARELPARALHQQP